MPGSRTLFLLAIVFWAAAPAAQAAQSCVTAYEREADRYWSIVNDIMQFKTLFDDYDRLCQKHYPDAIAALQPAADLLRAQTRHDMDNTKRVMTYIFDHSLPAATGAECAKDTAARNAVRDRFIAAMSRKSKTLEARLKKSAASLQDPKEKLTLCTQLAPLKPQVERVLGPGLKNPLLEMSVMNRALTGAPKHHKTALKNYRAALSSLD